ncbi:unnamed protein product [Musa banksii]
MRVLLLRYGPWGYIALRGEERRANRIPFPIGLLGERRARCGFFRWIIVASRVLPCRSSSPVQKGGALGTLSASFSVSCCCRRGLQVACASSLTFRRRYSPRGRIGPPLAFFSRL